MSNHNMLVIIENPNGKFLITQTGSTEGRYPRLWEAPTWSKQDSEEEDQETITEFLAYHLQHTGHNVDQNSLQLATILNNNGIETYIYYYRQGFPAYDEYVQAGDGYGVQWAEWQDFLDKALYPDFMQHVINEITMNFRQWR